MSTDPNTNSTPKAPVLCANDCGFFGSEVTGNCCSKCYLSKLKEKNDAVAVASVPSTTEYISSSSSSSSSVCENDSMDIDAAVLPVSGRTSPSSPAPAKAVKKKTKKASYKAMMSGMMKPGSPKDLRKEREALSKGLGGGAFSKIDQI
jgi:hypothetical protein